MILLIRFILVSMIVYLLIKSFVRYFAEESEKEDIQKERSGKAKSSGVSKEIGEYVDYEEVGKKKK